MSRKWIIATIIISMLVLCVVITAVSAFTLLSLRGVAGGPGFALMSVDSTEQGSFAVDGPATLDVSNDFGDVEILAADISEIEVTARKTAWGNTPGDAQARLDNLSVVMSQTGDRVTVRVERPPQNRFNTSQNASADFTIRVPLKTSVKVVVNSGKISLGGTEGSVDLRSDFGDVQVSDVQGSLVAQSLNGKVTAQKIVAGKEDIELRSNFGDVRLEDATAAGVLVVLDSGKITLDEVNASGKVDLSSNFGDIVFQTGEASEVTANTRSGKVSLSQLDVSGPITAHSDFGDLDLVEALGTEYDLSTNSGKITVEGAAGKVKARTDFGDIVVSEGEKTTLSLQTKSGKIAYSGSLGNGPHSLSSDFGDVEVNLPEESSFDFDMETGFGSIDSEFPTQINGKPNEKHWVGQVNNGGGTLTVISRNGNIRLGFVSP